MVDSCSYIITTDGPILALFRTFIRKNQFKEAQSKISWGDTSSWKSLSTATNNVITTMVKSISFNYITNRVDKTELSTYLEDLSLIEQLLEYDPACLGKLLCVAVWYQKIQTVQYICQFNVTVSMKNHALIHAAIKSNLDIVRFLCENGAEHYIEKNLAYRIAFRDQNFDILLYLHSLDLNHPVADRISGYYDVLLNIIQEYSSKVFFVAINDTNYKYYDYNIKYTKLFKFLFQISFAEKKYHDVILRLCAESGNMDLMMYMCNNGADVCLPFTAESESNYCTCSASSLKGDPPSKHHPLLIAVKSRHYDIIKYICDIGGQYYYAKAIQYALNYCGKANQLTDIKFIISCGYNINYSYDYVLRTACSTGNLDLVRYLCEHGADVNVRSYENHITDDSPLLAAAYKGHIDIVQYLLMNGAKIYFNYSLCKPEIFQELRSFEKNTNKIKNANQ